MKIKMLSWNVRSVNNPNNPVFQRPFNDWEIEEVEGSFLSFTIRKLGPLKRIALF